MNKHELVLILDFGGPHNQLIARKARELNVYSEILPCNTSIQKIREKNPKGIIFAEGDGESASIFDSEILNLGIPVLENGLHFGENHNDIENEKVMKNFLYNICHFSGDWTTSAFIEESINSLKSQIGDGKVLLALSGGVDSSVCAALLSKAVGKNLTCIFVNHGLLRKNEFEEVKTAFTDRFGINLIGIDAEARFLGKLAGVSDPETKRKIIGEEFIRVFEEEANRIGAVDFLAQGTIYPDIMESGVGKNAVVKSHHNVGGLPEHINFKELVEPLKDLFKNEVRAVGLELGIPEHLVFRQPFPGPGLGVRVIGDLTKEKLDVLRDADYIFREEIAKAGLDKDMNQYFAVLTNLKSVGVRNEARTYDYTLALRAVKTIDFMSATWCKIPYEVLELVSSRITNEVEHVNRVVYDITSKPPSTIEWE